MTWDVGKSRFENHFLLMSRFFLHSTWFMCQLSVTCMVLVKFWAISALTSWTFPQYITVEELLKNTEKLKQGMDEHIGDLSGLHSGKRKNFAPALSPEVQDIYLSEFISHEFLI